MTRRRDRSNELLVAIVVIGTLVVALTFGIILTLSANIDDDDDNGNGDSAGTATAVAGVAAPTETASLTPTETPGNTATPSPTNAPLATATPTASDTAAPLPTSTPRPSDTPEPSDTPQPSETPEPSDTPEPSETPAAVSQVQETDTPESTLPPTATRTATRTATPSRTPSPTVSATATRTLRPSATPSDTPTVTNTATNTATYTATHTATRTPSPTLTHTLTRTPSRTPTPSDTPTATRTPSVTPTPTPRYTLTFTPYPTLTPSITPFGGEQTRTPVASGCVVPDGWLPYFIQANDTLYSLAQRFGVTVAELAEANCITEPERITAGQILYAPPGSDVSARPTAPGGQAGGTYTRFNCDNPIATISDPRPGAVLRGTVGIYGTAVHPNFDFYRLQISGSTEPENFITLNSYENQVQDGQLGTLDTRAFAPGDYWLRLTVVDNTANYPPECTVRVQIAR